MRGDGLPLRDPEDEPGHLLRRYAAQRIAAPAHLDGGGGVERGTQGDRRRFAVGETVDVVRLEGMTMPVVMGWSESGARGPEVKRGEPFLPGRRNNEPDQHARQYD